MYQFLFLLLVTSGSVVPGAGYYQTRRPPPIPNDREFPFYVEVRGEQEWYCSGVAMLSHLVVTSAWCAMYWSHGWILDTTKFSVWQGNREFEIKRMGFPHEIDINTLLGDDIAYFDLYDEMRGPFYPPCIIKPGQELTDVYVARSVKENGKGKFVRIRSDCHRAIKKESEICFNDFGGKGVLKNVDVGGPLFRFPLGETKCILGVSARTGDENVATRLDYYWPRIKKWYYLESTL